MKVRHEYGFFLIFYHGFKYKDQIISMIQEKNNIEIIHNLEFKMSPNKLIKLLYSHDYAPLFHLKSKTRYLKRIKPIYFLIFFINYDPVHDYLGSGDFRHLECLRIKSLKTDIRLKYNPYVDGEMSHDHIIHSGDNEIQTLHMVDFVKKNIDSNFLLGKFENPIAYPYHLNQYDFRNIIVRLVSTEDILYPIIGLGTVRIDATPQYKALNEQNYSDYEDYLRENRGLKLRDFYSINKFIKLNELFVYGKSMENLIIVTKVVNLENKYRILDGTHRSAILAAKGHKEIMVGVVENVFKN